MTEYAYSSSDLDHSSTEKIQYVIWAGLQSFCMEIWLTNKALLLECEFPQVFDEPKVCSPRFFECWFAAEMREIFDATLEQCCHFILCKLWILNTNCMKKVRKLSIVLIENAIKRSC